MKIYQYASLAGLISLSANAQAISISTTELPTAISPANCPGCNVSTNSNIDLPTMSVFDMLTYDTSTGTARESWLLRYNLSSNSRLHSVEDQTYFGGDGITTTITPYTGYLWLEAPKVLDFNNPNQFNVYTDKIMPDPDNSITDALSTWSFSMSATDAIAGSANYYFSGFDGSGVVVESGNLSILDGLFICVECGIDVTMNLVGLDYSSGTAGFNVLDNRGLVLEYRDFFDYFTDTRTFAVAAVPVPAAFWLFSSGLVGLLGLSRRRK